MAAVQELGDDLLACVLGGVYTDVEQTMIEIQRTTLAKLARRDAKANAEDNAQLGHPTSHA